MADQSTSELESVLHRLLTSPEFAHLNTTGTPDTPSEVEPVAPYTGEIIDRPGTGAVVVITGYHSLEQEWGELIQKEFKKQVTDKGKKILFLNITDSPVPTLEKSPEADQQILQFIEQTGNVELVIDIHYHPTLTGDGLDNYFREENVLFSEDDEIHQKVHSSPGLITFPSYRTDRTGGKEVPYAVSDPYLPAGGIEAYNTGTVPPIMQKAINSTLSFMVDIANTHLESSAQKNTLPSEAPSP